MLSTYNQVMYCHLLVSDFIERMEYKYGEAAAANGCHVASAAGFDSIPADLGVLFAQRAFKPPAVPAAVESFLALNAGRHGICGTCSDA